jgi:hypothetical protein
MPPLSFNSRVCWAVVLLVAGGPGEASAQIEGANAGQARAVEPVTPTEPRMPTATPAPAPPRPRPSTMGEWPQAKRIYFPPDPPPLGAQINVDPHRLRSGDVPRELGAHVTEAFYAPVSTCLVEFSENSYRKFRPRIDAYTKAREQLLAELRALVAAQAGKPAEARAQEFGALAQRQARALEALEKEAEALRTALADKVSWYDLRQWKLGAGALDPRLPEHRVLEFQVVRAAAFYQPGLLPAQRRLLREAVMLMQDEMFEPAAADAGSAPAPPPRLVFFSPDLVRLLPMAEMPPAIVDRLEEFVAEKDALREEVTAMVISEDKAKFTSSRRRALGKLAQEQEARLAALDGRAEEIRRDFQPVFDRHRLARPYVLPADVAAMIDRFFAVRGALQAQLEAQVEAAVLRVRLEFRGTELRELRDLQQAESKAVLDAFSAQHMKELVALDAQQEQIHTALVACVGEAALRTEIRSPSAFLTEFMARYRQSWAYYEYEIAVFEPALSPEQRRLMFGGAIRWLDLPLPRGERQPMALPLTILNEEQKQPGARLR